MPDVECEHLPSRPVYALSPCRGGGCHHRAPETCTLLLQGMLTQCGPRAQSTELHVADNPAATLAYLCPCAHGPPVCEKPCLGGFSCTGTRDPPADRRCCLRIARAGSPSTSRLTPLVRMLSCHCAVLPGRPEGLTSGLTYAVTHPATSCCTWVPAHMCSLVSRAAAAASAGGQLPPPSKRAGWRLPAAGPVFPLGAHPGHAPMLLHTIPPHTPLFVSSWSCALSCCIPPFWLSTPKKQGCGWAAAAAGFLAPASHCPGCQSPSSGSEVCLLM